MALRKQLRTRDVPYEQPTTGRRTRRGNIFENLPTTDEVAVEGSNPLVESSDSFILATASNWSDSTIVLMTPPSQRSIGRTQSTTCTSPSKTSPAPTPRSAPDNGSSPAPAGPGQRTELSLDSRAPTGQDNPVPYTNPDESLRSPGTPMDHIPGTHPPSSLSPSLFPQEPSNHLAPPQSSTSPTEATQSTQDGEGLNTSVGAPPPNPSSTLSNLLEHARTIA